MKMQTRDKPPSTSNRKIGLANTGSVSHSITIGQQLVQVLVHVLRESSEGRGNSFPHFESPWDNVYNIESTLQGVVPSV